MRKPVLCEQKGANQLAKEVLVPFPVNYTIVHMYTCI